MKTSIFRMKRAGRYGTRALAGAAILLAALIVVNLLVSLLPASLSRFGVGDNGLSDMSSESKSLVKGLTEDVTIYWLCSGGTVDTTTIGGKWLELLLDRYEETGRHITVERIDPTTDTAFIEENGLSDYSNHSFLVESARRTVAVDFSELFLYSNSYINQMMYEGEEVPMTPEEMTSMCNSFASYYGMDITGYVYNHSSVADAKLATAIDYVTREDIPHTYLLTGYTGTKPSDGLKEYLSIISDSLGILDLSKEKSVPADANCLVLFAPTADLSDEQTALLRTYLNDGGSLVMATSPNYIENCPNIQSIAADFGLSSLPGLVLDTAEGNYVSGTSTDVLSLAVNSSHTLYSMMGTQKFRMPQSHAIAAVANLPTGVTTTPLFSTSEQASRVEAGNVTNKLGDSVILNVAMSAQKSVTTTDGAAATAQLVWFGSTDAFSEETAEATEGMEYICMAMATSLVSQAFESSYDGISAVPLYASSSGEVNSVVVLLLSVTLLLVLPAGLLVAGIVIWIRRKRRR